MLTAAARRTQQRLAGYEGSMPKMTTGNLSPEALGGWKLFARSRGVNVTALLEAMGRRLRDMDQPEARLPDIIRLSLADARVIEAERLDRSQP